MTRQDAPESRRLLIVEDEFLVAAAIEKVVQAMGLTVAGPVGQVGDALRLMDRQPVDGAVLDIKLRRGECVYPIAARLRSEGVPFIFLTAFTRGAVAPPFSTERILAKPFSAEVLRNVIAAMLDSPRRD